MCQTTLTQGEEKEKFSHSCFLFESFSLYPTPPLWYGSSTLIILASTVMGYLEMKPPRSKLRGIKRKISS